MTREEVSDLGVTEEDEQRHQVNNNANPENKRGKGQTSSHYCGMYIPLSDDKHRKVRDSSKKRTGNPRQIQSEAKCSLRIFFRQSEFFFVSD